MADQTIEVSYDTTHGFTFEQDGQPLPNGDVTVDTRGTNSISFTRKSGQSWTFHSFSMSLGVWADDHSENDVVTVGPAYGDSFSWSVGESQVDLTDDDQVPEGSVHTYKYSFIIYDGPEVGFVPCDPKIYNRIR